MSRHVMGYWTAKITLPHTPPIKRERCGENDYFFVSQTIS
jgi:hypothetical protein